jgi:branched-chain amino acid aminotransferase
MLDSRGFVAETNATHLFIVEDGTVTTSRLVACPEGITREVVLGLCRDSDIPHEVRDFSLTEVYRADELFCTGTMGELAPVTHVDGRPIGGGDAGPTTRRLAKLFDQCVAAEAEPVLD